MTTNASTLPNAAKVRPNRIGAMFSSRKGKKVLALFLTGGFPHLGSAVEIVPRLAAAGADLVEIGIPFSDPMADGPVIQKSSMVALANGITLLFLLDQIRKIRRSCQVPIVLMGYVNPILRYGPERFFDDAAEAGVDGVILPELPLEEAARFREKIVRSGLAQILLVTPTTPPERIAAIDAASSGFLYCVATTGVTGVGGKSAAHDYVANVRAQAKKNPLLVGFGISSPDDARRAASQSDGVIVGSALIKRFLEGETVEEVVAWVRSLKDAIG